MSPWICISRLTQIDCPSRHRFEKTPKINIFPFFALFGIAYFNAKLGNIFGKRDLVLNACVIHALTLPMLWS